MVKIYEKTPKADMIFAAIQKSKDPHQAIFYFFGYVSQDLERSLSQKRTSQIVDAIKKAYP